jgi:cellobiose phosphorylase
MDRVGENGRGESVWLAFFMYDLFNKFIPIARAHGNAEFAQRLSVEAEELRKNIEANGWDGDWYLRAYFDDGKPLGSSRDTECSIDSIAQSWSVLSGAGEKEREHKAMEALDSHLVRRDLKLVELLEPPFDTSNLNPGYIKGYVPGVRENGGQYTHAAIWAAMAFAKLRDERAWELCSMVNPVNHARSKEEADIYKIEPYVIAADVYASEAHAGRGGWSWYTGSASWMYRLMLESIIGISREGTSLRISPFIPRDWKDIAIQYRYHETTYHITIIQLETDDGERIMDVDGIEFPGDTVPLVNDHEEHWVKVRMPILGT